MRRIFIDTNVILDSYLHRDFEQQANRLLQAVADGEMEGYTSVGSIYTVTYYTENALRKRYRDPEECFVALGQKMNALLDTLTVVRQGNEELRRGVADATFRDMEDSYQLQAALAAGCDALVTINTKDFPAQTPIPVVHLAEFEI